MSIDAGFNNYYRNGNWLPILVSISNSGRDLSGRIVATWVDVLGNNSDFYVAPLDLAKGASKQVRIYLPAYDSASQIRVDFVAENTLFASESRGLRLLQSSDTLLTILTDSPRGVIDLQTVAGANRAYQAIWQLPNMPRLSESLRSLDVIVLMDVDTGKLSAEQVTALEGYVLAGGHLVVTGGPNWQLTAAGVSRLLPFVPNSSSTLLALPSVAAYAGQPNDPLRTASDAPIIVAEGTLAANAQVLASQSGLPMVVRHKLGGGLVDYLAFDPSLAPFDTWAKSGQFWFTLLNTVGQKPIWANGISNTWRAASAADAVKSLRLPDAAQLGIFLLGYIVLVGPLNYLLLRRIKRREWAWITVPMIVVGVSALYYVAGASLRGSQPVLNQLSLVQVWPNHTLGKVDAVLGVLSPRRGVYDLVGPEGYTVSAPNNSASNTFLNTDLTMVEGNNYTTENLIIDSGTSKAFVSSGYATVQPLEGAAEIILMNSSSSAPAYIDGDIKNTTGQTLQDVVVIATGGSYYLGLLGPNESRSFRFPMQADSSPPFTIRSSGSYYNPGYSRYGYYGSAAQTLMADTYNYADNGYGDRTLENTDRSQELWRRQKFIEALVQDPNWAGNYATDVYVIGWTSSAPYSASLANIPHTQEDTTAYIYQIPSRVSRPQGATKIEIPAAYMTWATTQANLRFDASPYGLNLQNNETVVFRYLPMITLSKIEEIRIRYSISSGSNVGNAKFALFNWQTSQWEDVSFGGGLIKVADPARFIGPNGAVELQISTLNNIRTYYDAIDLTHYGELAKP
jgi:hypothetical protein